MKNIIVTGASRGLGLNITETLLRNSYNVTAISRNSGSDLEKLKMQFQENLVLINFDLADIGNINVEIFRKSIGYDKVIHGLINNAAVAYDDLVTNINIDKLQEMYRINVFAAMLMTKYAIRHMLLHKIQGHIIHITSVSAHTGYKGLAMYASTKGAIEAFSKNTAREWGEYGIHSNCIVPGFMETGMSSGLTEVQKNRIYKRTCLKKPSSVESVSQTLLFLLSDGAVSITGQNIHVDSGTL